MVRNAAAKVLLGLVIGALVGCTGDVGMPESDTLGGGAEMSTHGGPDAEDADEKGVLIDGAQGAGSNGGTSSTGANGDLSASTGTNGDVASDGPPPSDPLPPARCSESLAQRTLTTDLADLAGKVAECGSFAEGGRFAAPHPCARIAPAADGTLRFAYADKQGTVHVLAIDAAGKRFGNELTVSGTDVRGLFAHEDGVAMLVARGIKLFLVRLDDKGTSLLDKLVEGADDTSVAGARFLDDGIRGGALDWDGSKYTVYAAIKQNYGAQGTHEGDVLTFFDAMGTRNHKNGWDWGCSHSLELRLAPGMGTLSPICQADVYPKPGLVTRGRQLVGTPNLTGDGGVIWSGYAAQARAALLGGAVGDGDGVWISFASDDAGKRPTRDIGVLRYDAKSAGEKKWLTSLPAEQISWAPELMRFGKNLLLYWETSTLKNTKSDSYAGHLLELTPDGAATEAKVDIAAKGSAPFALRARDVPAVSVPGGDAAYLAAPAAGALSLVRVRACQ